MYYINKEEIQEQIRRMVDKYAVCRNAIHIPKGLKSKGSAEGTCRKIKDIDDDIKEIIKNENELIIRKIDKVAIPFYKTKNFGDDNLYHNLLTEIRPKIKDIKFILINPVNYYEIKKYYSGTVWYEYIVKNITNNILCTDQVPLDIIYAGDIGKNVAQLFIDIDFEINVKYDGIYVYHQVFLDDISNDCDSFAKIIYS